MRATQIRTHKGEIPSTDLIIKLEESLQQAMKKSGFISNIQVISRTNLKIGLHMCSFRINTEMHGYNADIGYLGSRCKIGYKLTSVPTWKQREAFNHMVNDCFDRLKLSARIMSGRFEVRNAESGRLNQWSAFHCAYNGGDRLFEIKALSEVECAV